MRLRIEEAERQQGDGMGLGKEGRGVSKQGATPPSDQYPDGYGESLLQLMLRPPEFALSGSLARQEQGGLADEANQGALSGHEISQQNL